jgi:hypothetical protein
MRNISIRADIGEEQLQDYAIDLANMSAEELIKEFLSYLDHTEESDNGSVFHPITIGCCRVMVGTALDEVLREMKDRT